MSSRTRPESRGSGYTAIVLAGERPAANAVAAAAGVPRKVLADVGGRAMIHRVIAALQRCGRLDDCVVVGGEGDREHFARVVSAHTACRWCDGAATPAASAAIAMAQLHRDTRVLLTTGDHPLLETAVVSHLCDAADQARCDVLVALARYRDVLRAVPQARCTPLRFRDDVYCGTNLYVIATGRGRRMAEVWQRVEMHRKRPWRLMSIAGPASVFGYLLGRLTLAQAMQRLSARFKVNVQPCIVPYPLAALDVDTVADWRLAQSLWGTVGHS